MKAPRPRGGRRARAWVGVVSRSHVLRGVAGGFAQLCHGRCGPLMRMAVGDWLVYYSPRTDFPRGAPLRAFTALGRVVGERAYEVEMGRGFVPYRRDIAYVKGAREVPLRELASTLEFVTHRPGWGMLARRGHFEIGVRDLRRIAVAMGAAAARKTTALKTAPPAGAGHRLPSPRRAVPRARWGTPSSRGDEGPAMRGAPAGR